MKRFGAHLTCVSLSILLFIPVLLHGQQQPAGIVTTLQGNAELTRPTRPASALLRFKDDVFVRDVINTREKSLVRVLFGGKSTVTVRELTRLEVREENIPGGGTRSIHELHSGGILVNVAKQLMGPRDEVVIRTPNAVVAIRGSITYVGCDPILLTCNIIQVTGSATVNFQGGTPQTLLPNTTTTVTGNATTGIQATPVTNIPPAQVNQTVQQFSAPPAVQQEANSLQTAAVQLEQATQLARAVVTAATGVDPGAGATPGSTGSTPTTSSTDQQLQDASTGFGGNGGTPIPTPGPSPTPLQLNPVTTEVSTSADLMVTKTDSPDPVNVGSNLTYTITVTNNGPSAATGVTLTDALPLGVTLVSVTSGQGSCSGGASISCNLGTINNGASATVTITVTATAPGTITETASVSSSVSDPVLANNTVTSQTTALVPPPPTQDLVITSTSDPNASNFNTGAPVSFNTVTQSGGTLTGSDSVTASNSYAWTGGQQSGSGSTEIPSGATLDITGPDPKTLDMRTLNNAGTANFTGGTLFLNNSALFSNIGTFNAQNSTAISSNAGISGSFDNSRNLNRSGAGTTTTVSVPFNNTGTAQINSGTLALTGGGNSTGSFSGAGTLQVGGNYTFAPASSITNSNVEFSAGTAGVQGTYDLVGSSTTVSGGTANFTGTLGAVGNLSISSGTANFSSGETIAPTSLALSGGTLTGSDTVNLSGASNNWTGGTQSGSGSTNVLAGGTLNISGLLDKTLDARTLNNAGTANVSGGTLVLNSGALFSNTGSFNNSASVDLQSGTLSLLGGGTSTGSFSGAGTLQVGGNYTFAPASSITNSNVEFSAGTAGVQGTYDLVASNTTVSGGTANFTGTLGNVGNLSISSGTANFSSGETIAPTSLALSGGTLTGSDTVNLSGASNNWTGGTQSGSGSTNVLAGGTLNISGLLDKTLDARTLNNAGTANLSGGTLVLNNGALFSNSATFNAQGTTAIASTAGTAGNFSNSGTFDRSGAGTTTTVSVPFNNTNTTQINSGTLSLSGGGTDSGGFNVASGAGLNFSGGTHDLNTGAALTGAGDVNVTAGTLNLNDGGIDRLTGTLNVTGGSLNAPNGLVSLLVGQTLNPTGTTLNVNGGIVNHSGANPFFNLTGGIFNLVGASNSLINANAGNITLATRLLGLSNSSSASINRFFSLAGSSSFSILNDGLARISGGSSLTVTGNSLGIFGAGTNTLSFGNAPLCGTGCVPIGSTGFNILLTNGAVITNVSIDPTFTAFTGLGGTNTIAGLSGADRAILVLDGGTSMLALGTNPLSALVITNVADSRDFSSGTNPFFTTALISGGALTGSDGVTFLGQFDWSGGSMTGTGTTFANGGTNLSGSDNKILGRTLINPLGQTVNWTGGSIGFQDAATLTNLGTFRAAHASNLSLFNNGGTGSKVFDNQGTFIKENPLSGTVGNTDFSSPIAFNSSGSVQIQAGAFRLFGGGTSTGSFSGAGTLEVGSAYTFASGSSITTSNVEFSSGTVGVQGTYNLAGSNTTVSGGTANFTGTLGAVGNLSISSGTANFSSGETIAPTSLALSGGTLTGSDTVNLSGASNDWTGGTQSGSGSTNVLAGGTLNISGLLDKTLDARTLSNAGTANVSGGTLVLNNGALFSNSTTFNAQGTTAISSNTGVPGSFDNSGSFSRSGAGTTTTVSVPFNNSGTALINSGTLSLSGGGTDSGSFNVANGAALNFSGGTHDLNTGAALTGAGNVNVNAGQINLNAGGIDRLTGTLNVAGGNVNATGSIVNVSGQAFTPTGSVVNLSSGNVSTTDRIITATQGATVNHSSANPLVNASGGTLSAATGILGVVDGSTYTGTTSAPAIQLNNTSANIQRAVMLSSLTAQQSPSMTVAGPLVSASNNTNINATNAFVFVGDSATLTGPPKPALGDAPALINFDNSSLTGTGALFSVLRSLTPGAPTTANLSGPVLSVTGGSTITRTDPDSGTLLNVGENGLLTSSGAGSLVETNGSNFNLTGKNLLTVNAGPFTPNPGTAGPATVNLAGGLLNDTGSAFNLQRMFFVGGGSTLSSIGTDPFLQFTNSTVFVGAHLADVNASTLSTGGPFLKISGGSLTLGAPSVLSLSGGATATFGGSVADLTNLNLNLGTNPVVRMSTGSTLSNTAGPVIKLNGGSLTADALAIGDSTQTYNLTGTLMDLTNTTVTLRTIGEDIPDLPTSNFHIALAANEPFYRLNNSTLNVASPNNERLIFLSPSDTGATFLGVGMIASNNSSVINQGGGLAGMEGIFNTTSSSPFLQVTGSSVTVNEELIGLDTDNGSTNVTMAGQLLKSINSTFNVNNVQVNTPLTSIGLGAQPDDETIAIISNEKATTGTLNRAFVAIPSTNQVKVIDANTNAVIATTGVGLNPVRVANTPNNDRIFVLNSGSNNVSVIDTHTNGVVATIAVGTSPDSVAFTPDSNRAYVTNPGSNNVTVINVGTTAVIATIAVGNGPGAVAVTADGTKVYAANEGSSNVSVISTATNTVIGTIPVGSGEYEIVITPDSKKAYVTNQGSNNISVIDTATNAVVKTIAVGTGPNEHAITRDGKKVYVPNVDSNNVSVIDTATDSVIATIPVGSNPQAVAISRDGKRAYVTNEDSNNISVIDTATNTVIATVNSGTSPDNLALFENRDLHNLFVVNDGSNDVSVVETVELSDLFAVSGGAMVTSNTTLPFLEFDPTTVNTGGALVRVTDSGSSLTLSGPLIAATDTTFNIDYGALRVYNGGSVTGNGTGALIQLNGTTPGASTVNTVFSFAHVADTGSKLTLAGPFLNATNTTFNLGPNATSADTQTLLLFEEGAAIKSTSASPFVSLTGSTVAHSSTFFNLRRSPDNIAPAASMELAGPLLLANNSSFTTTRSFAQVVEKATLTGIGTTPLIQTSNSTFNIGDPAINVGSLNFFRVDNSFGQSAQGPATVNLAGPLASDSGSQFNILDSFFAVFGGSTLTSTSPNPLIQLSGSTVTTGSNPISLSSSTDQIAGTTLTLGGSLLSATNGTTFNPSSPAVTNSFMFVGDSSILNGPPKPAVGDAPALLNFTTSNVCPTPCASPTPFSSTRRSLSTANPTQVNLGGALLSAAGSNFNNSTFISVQESAQFTGLGTGALVQTHTSPSTITTTGNFMIVNDLSTGTTPGIAGPANVNLAGGILSDTSGSTFDIGSRFMNVTGGSTVQSSTSDPFIQFSGSTLSTVSDFARVTGAGSTVTLAGLLLSDTGSTFTIGSRFVNVTSDSTVTSSSTDPFMQFNNSTASVAVGLANVDTSTLNIGGSLVTTSTGSDLASTANGAFIRFNNSTVTAGRDLASLNASSLTVPRTILNATGGTLNINNKDTQNVLATPNLGAQPADSIAMITNEKAIPGTLERAFIPIPGANQVKVIDANTNAVISTIGVGTNPITAAATPDQDHIFVLNSGSSNVSIIDTHTNSVVATLTVGSGPVEVVFTPDSSKAYITNSSSNNVTVINNDTNAVITTLAVGTDPRRAAVTPDGTKVYVLNAGSNTVSVIDTATNTVIGLPINVGTQPIGLAVSPDGTKVGVINQGSNSVSVIDVATNNVTNIAVGTTPSGGAIMPNGKSAYIANAGSNNVSVIDGATNAVIATIPVGTSPKSVVISSDSRRVYVANEGSNSASVIDTATNTVVGTINYGSAPVALALTREIPGLFNLFAVNAGSSNASVVHVGDLSDLIEVAGGSTVTVNNSNGTPAMSFASATPSTTVNTGGTLLRVTEPNSKVTVSGPVLSASSTIFNVDKGFLRLSDSGGLLCSPTCTTTVTNPALFSLTGTTLARTAVNTVTTLFNLQDSNTSLQTAAPLLSATNTDFALGPNLRDASTLLSIEGGATVSSTTTSPFISLIDSNLTRSNSFFSLRRSPDNVLPASTMTLNGSLVDITNGNITTNRNFVQVLEKAALTQTGSNTIPLINTANSTFNIGDPALGSASNDFVVVSNNSGASKQGPATVSLSGPLHIDSGSTFTGLNRLVRVTDGSTLSATSPNALVQLSGSTVTTGSNVIAVSSGTDQIAGTTMTLGGPLLSATNNTSINSGSTFMWVADSATLNGPPKPALGDAPALIQFTDSTLSTTSPFTFFTARRSLTPGSPTTVNFGGPLLIASGSTFNNSRVIGIQESAQLTGSGTTPLVQSITSPSTFTTTGNFMTVSDVSGGDSPGTPGPAHVTLAGGLLSDTAGSTFNIGSRFQIISAASTVTSTSATDPFIKFSGSTVGTGNDFTQITGAGSKLTLFNSLLSAGSTLNIGTNSAVSGDVLDTNAGGQLVINSTDPVLLFNGGTHTIGTAEATAVSTANRIARIQGDTATGIDPVTGLGTFQAVKGNGVNPAPFAGDLAWLAGQANLSGATNPVGTVLKATGGASIEVKADTADALGPGASLVRPGNAVQVDRALFEAAAPVIELISTGATQTSLTTSGGAIDINRSKMAGTGSLIALTNSLITVNNGPLLTVGNGSVVDISGDLLSMTNGSKINVFNGPLILVTGNSPSGTAPLADRVSTLNVSGALVNFGGAPGNTIIVRNDLCAAACAVKSGIQVLEQSGGLINIGPNPIKNPALGSILPQSPVAPFPASTSAAIIQATNGGKVNIKAP